MFFTPRYAPSTKPPWSVLCTRRGAGRDEHWEAGGSQSLGPSHCEATSNGSATGLRHMTTKPSAKRKRSADNSPFRCRRCHVRSRKCRWQLASSGEITPPCGVHWRLALPPPTVFFPPRSSSPMTATSCIVEELRRLLASLVYPHGLALVEVDDSCESNKGSARAPWWALDAIKKRREGRAAQGRGRGLRRASWVSSTREVAGSWLRRPHFPWPSPGQRYFEEA